MGKIWQKVILFTSNVSVNFEHFHLPSLATQGHLTKFLPEGGGEGDRAFDLQIN